MKIYKIQAIPNTYNVICPIGLNYLKTLFYIWWNQVKDYFSDEQ
ncbi:hypothetical protein [Flavobacterium terrisoli]|nr:hypothetical protein [Flavobacterium buctense]